MPREIVFKLNGGGDATPLGGVDRPDVVAAAVGPVPVVVVVAPGETSGEKTPPTAYSERLSPYCFARVRLTSRISMSKTISARALSFCEMMRSMICTIGAGARTVIVLAVLLNWIDGCTGIVGSRISV